jgi:hypothetical protein
VLVRTPAGATELTSARSRVSPWRELRASCMPSCACVLAIVRIGHR